MKTFTAKKTEGWPVANAPSPSKPIFKSFFLLFLLISLFPSGLSGKGKTTYTHLRSLYSNAQTLSIDKVVFEDTATVVYFTAKGKINSWFRISPTTYLSNENATRYPVKGASGLKLGENCYIPKTGATEFRLFFSPMPSDTRIFDLIEGTDNNMYRIYGIHDSKTRIKIPVAKEETAPEEISADMFRKGKARIRGRIEGYVADQEPNFVSFDMHTFEQMTAAPENVTHPHALIRPDGTFDAEIAIDHPIWGGMKTQGRRPDISFYIRPGDVLDMTVKGFYGNNLTVEYTSSHPKGCYENLLKHQHVPVIYHNWNKLTQYGQDLDNDTFLKRTGECIAENMRLCDYVAWKYKFSPWETHLLKNRQKLLLTEHHLMMASRLLQEKMVHPNKGGNTRKEDFIGYDYSMYKVLDNLPLNDPSLSLFFPSGIPGLNLIWPLAMADTYAFYHHTENGNEVDYVKMELEKDSLQLAALRELTGMEGTPWAIQMFLTSKICRLQGPFSPAQRAEVVKGLSAYLTHPYFKEKIKELDVLVQNATSRPTYEMPEGKDLTDLKNIIDSYKGKYVQVVWLSDSGSDAQFYGNPAIENLIKDLQNSPDIQFVMIANSDAYQEEGARDWFEKNRKFPTLHWINGEDYHYMQALLRFNGSQKQITFDRDGLLLKQSLDMRNETAFRQQFRHMLESEEKAKI